MAEKISFDTIPGAVRVPGQYIEFNTRTAVQGLPQNPQKLLIIGPMLADGKQPERTPVQLYSDAQAGELFGQGSWAQAMVKQVFSNNAYLDVTVIGVPDHEAGVAAVGSVAVSGEATTAGAVDLVIGGVEYSIAVTAGTNAQTVADKLRAKLAASPACLVTGGGTGANLTLTAKNKGQIGNEITLSVHSGAAGLSFNVTALANGQKNADISEALTVVAGKHYHVIACPFVDDANAKALSTHLTDVSNAIEQRGSIGVLGWRGTLATGIALAAKLNDGRVTCAWYKGAIEGNALIAAGYAAQLAAAGIAPGPQYGVLKQGGSIRLPDGRTVCGADYLSPPQPGRSVALFGDTRYVSEHAAFCRNADVLVHEATFGAGEEELAERYGHSTAAQAAALARDAQVRRLILTHISARHNGNTEALLSAAQAVFPETALAEDLSEFPVPFP